MANTDQRALSGKNHSLFHGLHAALEGLPLLLTRGALFLLVAELLDFIKVLAQVLHD